MVDTNFNERLSSLSAEEREEILAIAEEFDWSSIVSLIGDGNRANEKFGEEYITFLTCVVSSSTLFCTSLGAISDPTFSRLIFKELGRAFKGTEGNKQVGICDPLHPYRSMDGRCNNLQEVHKGSTFTKYRRILFPDYFRGISDLRRDQTGEPLPSARLISSKINRMTGTESSDLSTFHMVFGQFLDHDITSTPVIKFETLKTGTIMRCCDEKLFKRNKPTKRARRIGCAPIPIPIDDPFYSSYGQRCMEFLRSTPAPSMHLGPREQLNQQSSYLDGSVIYGTKQPSLDGDPLRTFVDGLLKEFVANNGQHFLPVSKNKEMLCNSQEHMDNNEFCFVSGDERVNEVVSLAFFHTVWCREHNRVAQLLKSFHPNATDEHIYQETRRILAAELQHITFNEFLPSLILH
ncbi:chorion peroxidase-like [Palaemon carinicauda]|uniref:chorion peroxidase-like n=1 Tax=Palaemon carinicauda TaxID=392227 RepID=UPI0035B60567